MFEVGRFIMNGVSRGEVDGGRLLPRFPFSLLPFLLSEVGYPHLSRRVSSQEESEWLMEVCDIEVRVPLHLAAECVGELKLVVSMEEPQYQGDCCRMDPFCEDHGIKKDCIFYLVRVPTGGVVEASVGASGVRVKDSWCLGELGEVQNLPLRYLLGLKVRAMKEGSGSDVKALDIVVEKM